MMEVLITFPLKEDTIDLTILDEIMLVIYQPRNIYDDRFDRLDELCSGDGAYKPLLFTQKSAANHVIIDGIHEISFHMNLPKGTYIYLHKQMDTLYLNDRGLITTLGNGRKVNYVTADEGGGVSFDSADVLRDLIHVGNGTEEDEEQKNANRSMYVFPPKGQNTVAVTK